jgi:glycosyltransferase involved in cell wall biosynthesis
VPKEITPHAFENVFLNKKIKLAGKLLIPAISNPARFARHPKFKNFKINTKEYDLYIQQQIDPITVSDNTRHVVRLHDILPITHPQFFENLAVHIFSRGLSALLKDDNIYWVLDTKSSATEFKKIFGEKLSVFAIPCAVGLQYESIPTSIEKTENRILVINTIEPRKNITTIIEAFEIAKNNSVIPNDYILTILGSKGWQDENLYQKLVGGKYGNYVEFIESPSDLLVAEYLERSKILVSASSAEGFGLPPLEGMLFGCIPVVSDIPQHRETIGEHGIFFQIDSNALSQALQRAHLLSQDLTKKDFAKMNEHVRQQFSLPRVQELWTQMLQTILK